MAPKKEDMRFYVPNAYGLDDFKWVKCTRCKNVSRVGGHGVGFCQFCDNHVRIFNSRDRSKELLIASKPVAFPAEWVE